MDLYKYSGAGNTFVILDGRFSDLSSFREAERISNICQEHHTDGIMILDNSERYDFRMEFFNPDGSGGMMCGNGGRCIAAFAASKGILPSGKEYVFEAADGIHTAEIVSKEGNVSTVRLKMVDVNEIVSTKGGWFLNTGTRQFVKFTTGVDEMDVFEEGKALRWDDAFAPLGTNVCFVEPMGKGELKIRTFEKGVEGETLACGTGITASAIAAYHTGISPAKIEGERVFYELQARIADLFVDFIPASPAKSVYLTGPAEPI